MSHADPNGSGPVITAAAILALQDLEYAEVKVPEWGIPLGDPDFTFRIRTLSIDELEQLVADATVPVKGKPGMFRRDQTLSNQLLFQRGVVSPSFTPAEVKQLWVHNAVPVGRVLAALNKLNKAAGYDEEVATAAAAFPEESAAPAAV